MGIRVSHAEALRDIASILPPGWRPSGSRTVDHLYSLRVGGANPGGRTRRYHLLYLDAARIARSLRLDAVLEALATNLELLLAVESRRRLFVHAGVIGWRGRALLIPGRSFSGKSTLVSALVRAGARFYSDEYAVLDARGRVHPYPRRLSLRDEDGRRIPPSEDEQAALPAQAPIPVGWIVASEYRAGARWAPQPLSPAQAVLALLANTVAARTRPGFALAVLKEAVRGASAIRSLRGEAEDVARYFMKRWERRAA